MSIVYVEPALLFADTNENGPGSADAETGPFVVAGSEARLPDLNSVFGLLVQLVARFDVKRFVEGVQVGDRAVGSEV